MANLNSWQKLTRVLPGKPFGDGSAGDATVSSDPNTRATASGSASSTSLTIGSAILSNGDVFVVAQLEYTTAFSWEINQVESGGGTTSITCKKALYYTYGTGAQVIKFNMNKNLTVSGFTGTGFSGNTGGIGVLCGQKAVSISGTTSLNGYSQPNSDYPTGGGFRAADGTVSSNNHQGESYQGVGGYSTAANYGGGGGAYQQDGAGGGGGGHVSNGGTGVPRNSGTPGAGGGTYGYADLTGVSFGSAGGCAADGKRGGNGGGIWIIIGPLTVTGGLSANGGAGVNGNGSGGGGGGSGGSILIVTNKATIGTGIVTATGGNGGSDTAGCTGGAGSVGRIAVHHSGTVTGTTTPTFTDVTDASLIEVSGGILLAQM